MKQFANYRHIRKRALIYGLPLMFFALQMTTLIGSLLVIIFSFSFETILCAVLLNFGLYMALLRYTANPLILHFNKVFPRMISNKRINHHFYED